MIVDHCHRDPPPLIIAKAADTSDQLDEDADYDECREKHQWLVVTVAGSVEYRVRLPRGLQHRHTPEVQIEVPCVELKEEDEKALLKRAGGRVAPGQERFMKVCARTDHAFLFLILILQLYASAT